MDHACPACGLLYSQLRTDYGWRDAFESVRMASDRARERNDYSACLAGRCCGMMHRARGRSPSRATLHPTFRGGPVRYQPIIVGQRFDRLVVTKQVTSKGSRRVEALCDCGQSVELRFCDLTSGRSRSCGCLHVEGLVKRVTRHGAWGTTEYTSWAGMKDRCLNPRNKRFADYGGRGIGICQHWVDSFEAFLADMGPRPSPAHSLDRWPDNDGDYEPGNVRWATHTEQANNRRTPKRRAR